MKNKKLLWLGLIFIALAFSLFLMIDCKPRSCPPCTPDIPEQGELRR